MSNQEDMASRSQPCTDANALALAALTDENAALTKALTGLTCGGSEFFIRKGDRYVADIDACVAWVRRSKEDAHRRTVEAIHRARAAEAKSVAVTLAWSAEAERLRKAWADQAAMPNTSVGYFNHKAGGADALLTLMVNMAEAQKTSPSPALEASTLQSKGG